MAQYDLNDDDDDLPSHTAGAESGDAATPGSLETRLKSRAAWTVALAAVEQSGCIVLLITIGTLLIGIALDGRLQTKPMFTLCLTLGGMPVSLYLAWRIANRIVQRFLRQNSDQTH